MTTKPNQTNYHSHCTYCDGRANMEDFIRFAIGNGFSSYGFSSHAPLPFNTAWTMEKDCMKHYLNEFHYLKDKYANTLELCIGLEIDYLNRFHNPASTYFNTLPLNYRIGSIHLLYDSQGHIRDADLPADKFRNMVNTFFHGDIKGVVEQYYERSFLMIETGGFDIVGHADKIHYNANCYRPGLSEEPWYDTLVHAYFKQIAERGYIMEINTKAFKDFGVFYPDRRYFNYLHDLNVRVQVNSDAHYPDRMTYGRAEALQALSEAGFTHVIEWHEGHWKEVEIDQRYSATLSTTQSTL